MHEIGCAAIDRKVRGDTCGSRVTPDARGAVTEQIQRADRPSEGSAIECRTRATSAENLIYLMLNGRFQIIFARIDTSPGIIHNPGIETDRAVGLSRWRACVEPQGPEKRQGRADIATPIHRVS